MATTPVSKISILLNGGIDNRTDPELVTPVVATGTSPALLASENTRLSVIPNSVVRSPDTFFLYQTNENAECYGIVPATATKGAVAFFGSNDGYNRQIAFKPGDYLEGPLLGSDGQNQSVYRPVQLTDAGAIPATPASSHIATTYNSYDNLIWYAYLAPNKDVLGSQDIYAVAFTADGTALCSPQRVDEARFMTSWVGLTAHGVNGVRLWYILADTGTLNMRSLSIGPTLASRAVIDGGPIFIYAPGTTNSAVDVCAYDDNNAIVVSSETGLPNNGVLLAVNVNTATVSAASYPNRMLGSQSQCTVYVDTVAGTKYVAYMFSSSTNGTSTIALVTLAVGAGTFSAPWVSQTIEEAGTVACKFLVTNAGSWVVYARSPWTGSFEEDTATQATYITYADLATGVISVPDTVIPWVNLHNHGAQVQISATEMYPLFFTVRCYGELANATKPADYVDDPSVEAYLVADAIATAKLAPVARFGTLRGTVAPARVMISYEWLPGNGATVINGTKVFTTYRKDNYGNSAAATQGFIGRYVALDFTTRQPSIAHDRDGVALAAAALPFQWDGVEVVEQGGPMHSPHLAIATTGGTGSFLDPGFYSYLALYKWTDAAGLEHRSKPSNMVTIEVTPDGGEMPVARITTPDSLRDGISLGPVSVQLFATEPNGATFHLLKRPPDEITPFEVIFTSISAAEAAQAQIFSTTGANGEELFPQPPAPQHDITIVGSRAYAIDAEYKSRLMVSKIRIAGKGFEWAPALELNFPSAAGDLIAVREMNGTPVAITENGVYTLDGGGPSNTGQGIFSPPVFLSDFGCSNPDSVVRYPQGLLWQKNNYVARLAGNQVATFPNIMAANTFSGAAVLKNQDEVLLFTRDAPSILVYNYAVNRFTTWNHETHPDPVSLAVNVPTDANKVLIYSPAHGRISLIDGATTSDAASMVFGSAWFLPHSDFQDHTVLKDIVFSGFQDSPCDLTIEIYTNYEDVPTSFATWNSDLLTTRQENANHRFTVRMNPVELNSRAIRWVVYDELVGDGGSSKGLRPIALTLVTCLEATDSLLNELVLLDELHK